MLDANEQYNISAGIYFAFSNKKNYSNTKRTLSVKHNKTKRDKMLMYWNSKDFETYTRENFIILCLYINFTKSPSSLTANFTALDPKLLKEAIKFKEQIVNYRIHINKDIEFLIKTYGTNINLRSITHNYRKNNIKWFTYYFYVVASDSEDAVLNSRIDKSLYQRIKILLLYVTFNEASVELMKQILTDNIII